MGVSGYPLLLLQLSYTCLFYKCRAVQGERQTQSQDCGEIMRREESSSCLGPIYSSLKIIRSDRTAHWNIVDDLQCQDPGSERPLIWH